MNNRPKLKGVTLCTITAHLPLSLRSLRVCSAIADFNDVLLITPQQTNAFCTVKQIPWPSVASKKWYDEFCIRRLPDYIKTPYVLIVQWDSWIIGLDAWTEEFLKYDYIGARWPWHKDGHDVGNGGFSLRSRRLLESARTIAEAANPLSINDPEDVYISRTRRGSLQNKYGCKFPNGKVADCFAYEHAKVKELPFGFHDLRNFQHHCSPGYLLEIIPEIPDYALTSGGFTGLLADYRALAAANIPDAHLVVSALLKRIESVSHNS